MLYSSHIDQCFWLTHGNRNYENHHECSISLWKWSDFEFLLGTVRAFCVLYRQMLSALSLFGYSNARVLSINWEINIIESECYFYIEFFFHRCVYVCVMMVNDDTFKRTNQWKLFISIYRIKFRLKPLSKWYCVWLTCRPKIMLCWFGWIEHHFIDSCNCAFCFEIIDGKGHHFDFDKCQTVYWVFSIIKSTHFHFPHPLKFFFSRTIERQMTQRIPWCNYWKLI